MNDNVIRGLRTMWLVVLGTLATGGVTKVWESFSSTHSIDPTVQVVAGLACVGIISWAQAMLEDKTGFGFLVPQDRQVGDAVLGTGVGSRKFLSGRLGVQSAVLRKVEMANPSPSLHRHDQAQY